MSALSLTIRAALAQSGITSLVSQRVYPYPLPPTTTLPAIAVVLSSENEEQLLAGASRFAFSSVQIHCIAATGAAADRLGEAVKTGFRDLYFDNGNSPPSGASFQKEGVDFIDYTDDLTTFRRVMAYFVRWR